MVNKVRDDFPVLQKKVHGTPLIYLDNAATMQMPLCVMHAMREQVQQYHANVHRGMHYLSELSTARLESVRETVRAFIGAGSAREIIFTSGTTAAINIAAASLAKCWFRPGDRIFATAMEHHSNYLPWFEAAASADAVFVEVPFDDSGNLDVGLLERMFSEHTRLVAVTMVSNVLGTVNPVREIIQTAHRHHALVLVDAAQAMQHEKINVKELDCDFLCFSGHKIGGPTGTGVLYGKAELLRNMPPAAFGGGMVEGFDNDMVQYTDPPYRFEAGTPNITGMIGLQAAIQYLEQTGMEWISDRERDLLWQAEEGLKKISGIRILGNPIERAGVLSFNISGLHSFDVAKLMDQKGIALRSGHHCALPLLRRCGIESAVRMSPAFYNSEEEIDGFLEALSRVAELAARIRV